MVHAYNPGTLEAEAGVSTLVWEVWTTKEAPRPA